VAQRQPHELGPAPSLFYPVKAAVTRTRSAVWRATGARARARGLRILFYHRVSDDRDELAVPPRRFAEQMEALASEGLRAVPVSEVARLLAAGETPTDVIGLSFDDAYLDVAEHGGSVLDRLGFRASVYVATGVTDGRAPLSWYPEQPPLMTWDDIRSLDGGVFEFEPHTVTHPNLLTVDDAAAETEIVESKRELETRLGRAARTFCYPAGLFGRREREICRRAGFEAAVSCEPGVNLPGTDLLALRRVQVDARDSVLDVRAKAAGAHDRALPLRGAWRRLRYGATTRPEN
jgi:peptidoglycan/xylan/chitin deacetylase (PgdA/CDA1 family)